jgi:hypothetical protein
MSQWLDRVKFGDGHDGSPSALSGVINTYSASTGTVSESILTTTLSAADGDVIFIHQTQGTGAGQWELNQVSHDNGGNLSLYYPLAYTYGTGAQAVKVPQYTGGTIAGNLSCTAWDGTKGGVLFLMANSKVTLTGTINVNGADALRVDYGSRGTRPAGGGFRGGHVDIENDDGRGTGQQGETYSGDGVNVRNTPNNGGGCGADYDDGGAENWAGAGAGYATSGGNSSNGGYHQAYGGTSYGLANLTVIHLGSAGGGNCGGSSGYKNTGANGAGIVIIYAPDFDCSAGYIYHKGGGGCPTGQDKAGGSGSGGSFLGKFITANLGDNRIIGTGGPAQTGDQVTGGYGSDGRNHVDYGISITGTTLPALDSTNNANIKLAIYGGMI